jgi:hypothetical protein
MFDVDRVREVDRFGGSDHGRDDDIRARSGRADRRVPAAFRAFGALAREAGDRLPDLRLGDGTIGPVLVGNRGRMVPLEAARGVFALVFVHAKAPLSSRRRSGMSRTIRIVTTLGLFLGTVGLAATSPIPAEAATQFFVDSTGVGGDPEVGDGVCDDGTGKCTFRAAVEEAQSTAGLPTVVVPPGTYPLNEAKGIGNTIRILGSGRATTTIEWQGPTDEVPFQSGGSGAGLWFEGLTLDGNGTANGGIVYEEGTDTVSVDDVGFTGFTSSGLFNVGPTTGTTVTVERSSFDDIRFGVFIGDAMTVTVRSSVFTDMIEAGVIVGNAPATVESSTFYDIEGQGVVVNAGATVDVVNSTFSNVTGAAVFSSGPSAKATVESSTITGGDFEGLLGESGSIEVRNSIVGSTGNDCQGVTSKGYNLDTDGTCNTATGDVTAADPSLGALADNGGPTMTHLPAAGSPAIDAALTSACPATDQRGYGRPSGAECDIGAVEVGAVAPGVPAGTSRFVPLPPKRVFDTRPGEPGPGPKGFVGAGETIEVAVTDVGGVPATGVSAVVLNVTATAAARAGFITVWPTGDARPLASTHNLTTVGQTRPNLVTVPVGAGGKVSFFALHGAHLLADVAGYYTENGVITDGASDGRFVALAPNRVFDTRAGEPAPGPKGFVDAGMTIDVQMTGVAGVPSTGVAAVVVNLTGTAAAGRGFVTAWPKGQLRPLASTINLNFAGDTAPNLAVLPVGEDGQVSFYSSSGAHLLGDVQGYFTDDTATVDTDGLFVPLAPARVFDTRQAQPAAGPKGFVEAGQSITVAVSGVAGVPASEVAAAVLNVTATAAAGRGFVTGWPTGAVQPLASNINLAGAGDTRPNAGFLLVGTAGEVSFFVRSGAHLLADVAGYYLG